MIELSREWIRDSSGGDQRDFPAHPEVSVPGRTWIFLYPAHGLALDNVPFFADTDLVHKV